MDVSVCVPVYRVHGAPNAASLAAALPGALGSLSGELVVALNGVAAADLGLPDEVGTVDLQINRGVAPGWNAAAQRARGEILCFLNDDVVLGPGALAALARVLRERPEAGVVGPVGSDWDLVAGEHRSFTDLAGRESGDVVECDVVSGFFFACRRETYDAVGGFDEAYAPASWEEVDFCTAVRTRLGLRCYAVAGVDAEHEWGISARQPIWRRVRHNGRTELLWSIHRRNRRRFMAKWVS